MRPDVFPPPLTAARSRLPRRLFPAALMLSLAGCALLPTSQLDLRIAPTDPQAGEPPELVQNGIRFRLHRIDAAAPPPVAAPVADAPVADAATPDRNGYVVRAGDTLRVIVWDHPELNNPGLGTLVASSAASAASGGTGGDGARGGAAGALDPQGRLVQPDGTIYFPYAGRIKVAGLDVARIREQLARRLDAVIPAPQLDVAVIAFRSQRVYVSGAVRSPGAQALTDVPMTVADAIAGAGGYGADADLQSATLNRGGQPRPLDLYAFFFRGELAQNPRLQDGDVLNLPPRRDRKVFVLGEVAKPGSQVMPLGPLSLSEALADAGGLNPVSADAAQVYVFRASGHDPGVEVYQLDARNPAMLVLGDQFALRPRDIVFVDPARLTRFSRVVAQILPLASSLYLTSAAANP